MIKPRIMKGPFPERSPYGEVGVSGSPLAYLIDPGAGSASDHVQRQWPTVRNLEDITRRGGDITPLYAAVEETSYPFGHKDGDIPRTRAAITGYKKRVPFGGAGSVWSSDDKASIPVWEDTHPYTKLPAEVLTKSFFDLTQADVLLYARAADRADRDLDRMIWFKFFYDPAMTASMKAGDQSWTKLVGTKHNWYTHSLDAAVSLFLMKPSMIPTDVLDVVVMALEQRLDPNMVQFMNVTKNG